MRRRQSRGVGVHGAPAAVTYRCRLLWPDPLPDGAIRSALHVPPRDGMRARASLHVAMVIRGVGYRERTVENTSSSL